MIMSEAVLIVLISGLGCTFLTVIGAIITQYMSLKKSTIERQEIKTTTGKIEVVAEKTREENKEGFEELKVFFIEQIDVIVKGMNEQNEIITLLLRNSLNHALKEYRDKEEVLYSDKEIIKGMNDFYTKKGFNGKFEGMYKDFDAIPVKYD